MFAYLKEQAMSAFDTLIKHCGETYPHFECPRGQEDIAAAKKEYDDLKNALEVLARIPLEDFGKQNSPEYPLMGWNGHMVKVQHVLDARKALGWVN